MIHESQRFLRAIVITDNAKTFKSASSDVKKIVRSQEVQWYMVNLQVQWSFILEKAPWLGGFWERLVGSTKRCLKKTIGKSSLNFEEIRPVLLEVEGTLNNRPLTDEEEGVSQPVTPTELIYERQIITTPNGCQFEVKSTARALTKRARYQFRILDQFTRQWRREYLLALREYHHCRSQNRGTLLRSRLEILWC